VKVRLLPSSVGGDPQRQALTTFIVNGLFGIDGGSIGFALKPEEMPAIRDVVVTHTHSDHTASLPIFIAEAFVWLESPVSIYGTAEVVSALREFVFNDKIWPDFEKIQLMNGSGPTIRFQTVEPRSTFEVAGVRVTPIPVNHVVPTMGLLVQDDGASVVFTSDTYVTDEIWQVAREAEGLKAVFVDVSYPNELEQLAIASKHLTPQALASDLKKLDRDVEVYAVHIKPTNREQVVRQLADLGNPKVRVAEIGRDYEW
jgi:cAMP phosphodiesterase